MGFHVSCVLWAPVFSLFGPFGRGGVGAGVWVGAKGGTGDSAYSCVSHKKGAVKGYESQEEKLDAIPGRHRVKKPLVHLT